MRWVFSGYVRRVVEKEKPDLIIINKLLFWSSLASIGLRLRGHHVIQLTDALVGMTWQPRGMIPKIGATIYAWTLGWLLLKIASRIVFFHPQPEKLLKRLGVMKKSEVIPTGIDVSAFENTPRNQEPNQPVTLTYIGRLESVKGVDDFLASAVPLKKEFPNLMIQVVGWYKRHHPLVEQYSDDVEFTGLRDDVAALLAGSDIFVLPSHSEGLSNSLMEAMASGCACIATDTGGNGFLLQNGVSGFLFPPGDREALAAHIKRLLQDPAKRRAMGEAARKRIQEQFDWAGVGVRYHALFDSLGRLL